MADEKSEAFLKVIRGEDQGKGWELRAGQSYTIGRSRKCELVLADRTVSGSHSRFECRKGVWMVIDLQSTHGTLVNDQRILGTKPLFERDTVQVGRSLLEFREYEQFSDSDLREIDRGVVLPE